MKNILKIYFLLFPVISISQVGINTENPDPKAALDIYGTDKGLLLPRLNETQMNHLASGGLTAGMVIFNTTTSQFMGWNGTSWVNLSNTTPNNIPFVTAASISGITETGQTLIGNYTYNDNENDSEGATTFRWTRSDDNVGLNEAGIVTANEATYTLTSSDLGKYIKFYITPVAATGANPGNEVGTNYVGPITLASNPSVILAAWDFNGNLGSEFSVNATSTDATITSGVITRGIGISAVNNADRFNANNFTQPDLNSAISNNDYFEFSITPNNNITVTKVTFNYERSSTGPTEGVLRSSADNFTNDLATFSGMTNNSSYDVAVSSINNISSTLTFRLYLFGNGSGDTTGSGGFEGTGNDIIIEGITN